MGSVAPPRKFIPKFQNPASLRGYTRAYPAFLKAAPNIQVVLDAACVRLMLEDHLTTISDPTRTS
eukprot:6776926-Pyramimonas_sp.AAC.1